MSFLQRSTRSVCILLAALFLSGCAGSVCDREPLANPAFHLDGLAPGESDEFIGQLVERRPLDSLALEVELVFDVGGETRQLTWLLPRTLAVDLREGQEVEVLMRKTLGFGGAATGVRIRDNEGIVLLADDGLYGNALRATDADPFQWAQDDLGCRNRANRPGELNNFALVVGAGDQRVELVHGAQAELRVNSHLFSVLVVKSTARVDDVHWTDAPYSHEAFVIARTSRTTQ